MNSISQSTMGVGPQMCSDTMFDNIGIPTEEEHLQETLTQLDQRSTHRYFYMVKPLWGNIHYPNQCGQLEQFINAKENMLQIFLSQSIIKK
jgi:hypothetical protein